MQFRSDLCHLLLFVDGEGRLLLLDENRNRLLNCTIDRSDLLYSKDRRPRLLVGGERRANLVGLLDQLVDLLAGDCALLSTAYRLQLLLLCAAQRGGHGVVRVSNEVVVGGR